MKFAVFCSFYRTFKQILGSKSEIVNKPIMQDDPQRRKPDITKAKQELGWGPVVSVLFVSVI